MWANGLVLVGGNSYSPCTLTLRNRMVITIVETVTQRNKTVANKLVVVIAATQSELEVSSMN